MAYRHVRSRSAQQRGIALIIVLWITALLTLIASSFIHAMRTEINIVGNSVSRARLEAAANAGVHRALLEIVKPVQMPGRWNTDGVAQPWEFNGVAADITIVDESGKIDINFAPETLLRSLLRSQGMAEEEAAALADAIQDWRDTDTLKRLRGAEEAEYAAAGLNYKPANALFLSVDELRLVLGMNAALFERLQPLITIYSRQPGVNTQIATREVLRALPNVTDAQVDEFLGRRETARANKQPLPFFTAAAGFGSGATGVVSVRVDARGEGAGSFIREAVVLRLPNPKRSYTFLRWREGTTDAAAPGTTDPSVPGDPNAPIAPGAPNNNPSGSKLS